MVKKALSEPHSDKLKFPMKFKLSLYDHRTLPKGQYKETGFEVSQVLDIDISRFVTEYWVQIREDCNGNPFAAPFLEGVRKAVQYGYQLILYHRIQEYVT